MNLVILVLKPMKTEYEKMRSQELYYFSDPEIHASLVHAKKVCARLRSMTIYDEDYRQVIEELIPGIPQSDKSKQLERKIGGSQ